jgi:hypothetical protein
LFGTFYPTGHLSKEGTDQELNSSSHESDENQDEQFVGDQAESSNQTNKRKY